MDKNKTLDELIQEKRIEMMSIGDSVNIYSIYHEIKELAKTMTMEPIYRDVLCKPFFAVGEKDFVTMLYRQILLREPDQEGYINTLNLLLSRTCSRAQLLQSFAESEEGQSRNVRLIGLKKEILKERISSIMKRIPGVGYVGRWITNIVFLSRRMASLYHSYNLLVLRCENMEKQCMATVAQYTVLEKESLMLKEKCNSLDNELVFAKKKYDNLLERHQALCAKYEKVDNRCETFETYLENQKISREVLEEKNKEDKVLCDTFYLHYNEKLMPDSREDVKSRASLYIPKIEAWYKETRRMEEETKFVDLGCGECEWIELLSENGFNAVGVDSNDAVVDKVHREFPQINIVLEDSIDYLKQCEDNSVDFISSFHMVEHMDFLTIIHLLKECYRVLKKDGMLIVETPNPQNVLTSSYYFYMDPTHIRPIPPELMQFFIEESGFELSEKVLLNPLNFEPYEYREEDPIKDIVFRFNMEQAYSIMAVKR
ncbi:MAG: methyltransferase domain-containing protein [Lachnospiraceae bacterium]|nr:methyltransferase domain-containing protein [Lachnospiraceae bacterium]